MSEKWIFHYEFKLGLNARNVAKNINTAFETDTASEQIIWRWCETFRSSDMQLESEPRGHAAAAIEND